MEWLDRFKSRIDGSGGGDGRSKFSRKLLLLLALGIGLIVFNSLFSSGNRPDPEAQLPSVHHEDLLQDRQLRELTAMLNQIRGVSNVYIYLALEDAGRIELVANEEQSRRETVEGDGGGGSREITEITTRQTYVIMRDATGREVPLVIQENQPRYRGALVVADGVENPAVQSRVVEALRAVLGLPYHRITVLPRGNQ